MNKHIVTDPLEDIQKQTVKQTPMNHTYTQREQFKMLKNGTYMSETQQESITTKPRDNISQTNRRLNNGQKESVNSMQLNRDTEQPSHKSDTHTRSWYRRIQKPDRLTY